MCALIWRGMMGKQCQLRSLRAHINPGPYLQELMISRLNELSVLPSSF